MATWTVFLRAVNVGRRTSPMAGLREALTEAGDTDVETHMQTGNGCVAASLRSRAQLEADPLDQERLVVRGRAVHLRHDKSHHEAQRSDASVERAMRVATNRNAKVIRAPAQKRGR